MVKILWFLLEFFDNNWGYRTPLQKRFKVGDVCYISLFKGPNTSLEIGEKVTIIENGRFDYLVENDNCVKQIVYQHELN